jgi:hypothetical protein
MPSSFSSEDHLAAVLRAADPLAPDRRQPFIADVIAALQGVAVIGPGTVHRAIVAAQHQHFDPPRFATNLSAAHPGRAYGGC